MIGRTHTESCAMTNTIDRRKYWHNVLLFLKALDNIFLLLPRLMVTVCNSTTIGSDRRGLSGLLSYGRHLLGEACPPNYDSALCTAHLRL